MKISDGEWSVLMALWENDGAELGTLINAVSDERKWSKNTLHTYLTRMEKKGLVRIDKESSRHKYFSLVDKESFRKRERKSFLERVYNGAAGDLIVAFLKEEKITKEEREELRKILDKMEV